MNRYDFFTKISREFRNTLINGPDGTWSNVKDRPKLVHGILSMYLTGCFMLIESEGASRCWEKKLYGHKGFDDYIKKKKLPRIASKYDYISQTNLDAIAEIRNAVVHNDGDVSKNRRNKKERDPSYCEGLIRKAAIPSINLIGSKVQLEEGFLPYINRVTRIVLNYFNGK